MHVYDFPHHHLIKQGSQDPYFIAVEVEGQSCSQLSGWSGSGARTRVYTAWQKSWASPARRPPPSIPPRPLLLTLVTGPHKSSCNSKRVLPHYLVSDEESLKINFRVICIWTDGIWSPVLPSWLSGKESSCQAGDLSSIPGLGISPGEGNGSPLQYSCLENPMDKGPWWAAVHGVARVGHVFATKQWQQQVGLPSFIHDPSLLLLLLWDSDRKWNILFPSIWYFCGFWCTDLWYESTWIFLSLRDSRLSHYRDT